MRLEGKAVVITGATGIAAAGAQLAASEGARVFVISIDEDECRALTSELPGSGYAVADLSQETAAGTAFDSAIAHLGALDGLFAVAGGSGRRLGDGPIDAVDFEAWAGTFRLNADPAFLSLRNAVRAMRDNGGSAVLVGSVLASRPVPGLFATHSYAAAKGAIESLAIAAAAYYAPDGVRVNVVTPGLVDTPMAARAAADPETVAYASRKQPLAGGLLDPMDVARTAVFLLSDESSQVTGQVIAVDGGWSVSEA